MVDFGYDTEDYREIQPEYGTMADFEALVRRCQELDIKLILDFVPNHTYGGEERVIHKRHSKMHTFRVIND